MDTGTARTEPIDPAGALPFGLDERHARPPRTAWLRNLGVAVFIGLPIAAALAGLLGGGAPRVTTAATPAALMSVTAPAVLRSGNWFETLVTVDFQPHGALTEVVVTHERLPEGASASHTEGWTSALARLADRDPSAPTP